MSNSKLVPLTIQSAIGGNLGSEIVIGSNDLQLTYDKHNLYWYVVIDRNTLEVKVNTTTSDNTDVPSELNPYLGNSDHILILTTQNLYSSNLPQGNLYKFLLNEGAGPQLKRAEQIYEALNCGSWGWFCYTYVAILCDESTDGFELLDIHHSSIMTLSLMPFSIGGKTYYSPVSIK